MLLLCNDCGVGAIEDSCNAFSHHLERVPVSFGRHRVLVLTVFVAVWVPGAVSDFLDKFFRHPIALDRERMVRIGGIAIIDRGEILFLVFDGARLKFEGLDYVFAHIAPHEADAADDWRYNARARELQRHRRLKGIAVLADVVAGSRHSGNNVVRGPGVAQNSVGTSYAAGNYGPSSSQQNC